MRMQILKGAAKDENYRASCFLLSMNNCIEVNWWTNKPWTDPLCAVELSKSFMNYDLVARNLVNHGKVKEAIGLMGKLARIREQSPAEYHPPRLASQHAIAGAY